MHINMHSNTALRTYVQVEGMGAETSRTLNRTSKKSHGVVKRTYRTPDYAKGAGDVRPFSPLPTPGSWHLAHVYDSEHRPIGAMGGPPPCAYPTCRV